MFQIQKIFTAFCVVGVLAAILLSMRTVSLQNSQGLPPSESLAAAIDSADLAQIDTDLHGMDINAILISQSTPLMLAAMTGHTQTARFLIDRGANVNATNSLGWTALHTASSRGDGAMVNLLLQRGARVDAKSTRGISPLILAARTPGGAVVGRLLQAGADAKWRDHFGETALSAAMEAGNAAGAYLLQAAEANSTTIGFAANTKIAAYIHP